jgi:hypothetical protein
MGRGNYLSFSLPLLKNEFQKTSPTGFYTTFRIYWCMTVKLQTGLFLIGLGLGPAINSILPDPIKSYPYAWLIFVIIGIALIIMNSKQ